MVSLPFLNAEKVGLFWRSGLASDVCSTSKSSMSIWHFCVGITANYSYSSSFFWNLRGLDGPWLTVKVWLFWSVLKRISLRSDSVEIDDSLKLQSAASWVSPTVLYCTLSHGHSNLSFLYISYFTFLFNSFFLKTFWHIGQFLPPSLVDATCAFLWLSKLLEHVSQNMASQCLHSTG